MADKDLTKPTEIEFCTGSLGREPAVFKAVGGADEDYFMYVEDADLTQKMRTRRQSVHLVPQYTAIHAWHRRARSLKRFCGSCAGLLRYFSNGALRGNSPSQCLRHCQPSKETRTERIKCEVEGVSEQLFGKFFREPFGSCFFV